jgi:hypothetical protein
VKVTTFPDIVEIGEPGSALSTSSDEGTLSTMYNVPGAPPVQLYVRVYVNCWPDAIGLVPLCVLFRVRLICATDNPENKTNSKAINPSLPTDFILSKFRKNELKIIGFEKYILYPLLKYLNC